MKRFFSWVWRVAIGCVVVYVLFVAFIFVVLVVWPSITAESSAKSFCEAAVLKNDVDEMRDMYAAQGGELSPGFWRDEGNSVRMMAAAKFGLEWYDCVITLDEQGKPKSQEVVFVDG